MTNGINGINGINGCFIPPIAQGRAKSPCVGADSISARKVRVIAGASALGGQNDGRHPAKLARSCGSMPHWGIDRYATPQRRPLHLNVCGL